MLKTVNTGRIIKSAAILTSLIFAAISGAGLSAYAQTNGGFSIHAIIPDNQIDKRQTYFDLRMNPGDKQTVEIVITNTRDEELVAEVRLNAASTGRNGLIVYTEPDVRDELLKISITDVASIREESVTVPARGSKIIAINIEMPDKPVEGVILGGIAVTGGEPEYDENTPSGVSVKNKITYVIGLKLTESEDEPEADFDLAGITPSLVNYKTAVVATLKNKAARIVKGMDVRAQIFQRNSDAALHEFSRGDAEMAPLSSGDFVIDWKNQPLSRGTYRLKMTAEYNGKIWEWDEEFTIDGKSSDLNKGAVGLMRNYTWLYFLLGAAILAFIWFVAYHMGKRKQEDNNSKL